MSWTSPHRNWEQVVHGKNADREFCIRIVRAISKIWIRKSCNYGTIRTRRVASRIEKQHNCVNFLIADISPSNFGEWICIKLICIGENEGKSPPTARMLTMYDDEASNYNNFLGSAVWWCMEQKQHCWNIKWKLIFRFAELWLCTAQAIYLSLWWLLCICISAHNLLRERGEKNQKQLLLNDANRETDNLWLLGSIWMIVLWAIKAKPLKGKQLASLHTWFSLICHWLSKNLSFQLIAQLIQFPTSRQIVRVSWNYFHTLDSKTLFMRHQRKLFWNANVRILCRAPQRIEWKIDSNDTREHAREMQIASIPESWAKATSHQSQLNYFQFWQIKSIYFHLARL